MCVCVFIALQDMNDFSPVFSQSVYRGMVAPNAIKGTIVTTVMANDSDPAVSISSCCYSIKMFFTVCSANCHKCMPLISVCLLNVLALFFSIGALLLCPTGPLWSLSQAFHSKHLCNIRWFILLAIKWRLAHFKVFHCEPLDSLVQLTLALKWCKPLIQWSV